MRECTVTRSCVVQIFDGIFLRAHGCDNEESFCRARSSQVPAGHRNGKVKVVRYRTATVPSVATRQREISVVDFFSRNRDLLGFGNRRRAC